MTGGDELEFSVVWAPAFEGGADVPMFHVSGDEWAECWPVAGWDVMIAFFRKMERHSSEQRYAGLADACERWRAGAGAEW